MDSIRGEAEFDQSFKGPLRIEESLAAFISSINSISEGYRFIVFCRFDQRSGLSSHNVSAYCAGTLKTAINSSPKMQNAWHNFLFFVADGLSVLFFFSFFKGRCEIDIIGSLFDRHDQFIPLKKGWQIQLIGSGASYLDALQCILFS